MNKGCVFPVDFERLEPFRLFVLKLQSRAHVSKETAIVAAFRIWIDWFIGGKECRVLTKPCLNPHDHDWSHEDLVPVLSEASGIAAGTELVVAGLDSGFFTLTGNGSMLQLAHFWRFNAHCSPSFRTIQQSGGRAAAAARALREMKEAANHRVLVLESQGRLPFGSENPSADQKSACLLLIERIDRALSLDLRSAGEYAQEGLLLAALRVITRVPESDIRMALEYLTESLSPTQKPTTLHVLENFSTYIFESQK